VNEYRKTWAQILGGAALLSGVYFTWRTLQVNHEGQITERFTRAIDQLGEADDKGAPRLEIRLGGIYALERIARDSPERDYNTVMEVLTTYVRENAHWTPNESSESSSPSSTSNRATLWPLVGTLLRSVMASGHNQDLDQAAPSELSSSPPADIRAILTVIGRLRSPVDEVTISRNVKRILESRLIEYIEISLPNTDLRGANLRGANLQLSYLREATLQGAFLQAANLQGAFLFGANLSGASLHGAELLEASLDGADLRGANLQEARGLTQEQIKWTIGDLHKTKLPEGIDHPDLWSKSIEEQRKTAQERLRSLRKDRGG
jgi:hypothetical protein